MNSVLPSLSPAGAAGFGRAMAATQGTSNMQVPANLNGSTYEQQASGFTMAYAMVNYTDTMMDDVGIYSFATHATHRGFWLGLSMRLKELTETDTYYNPELQQKAASIFNRISF